MFAEYLQAAMSHAQYERIEDGSYFGSIPGFQGVWANGKTEEAVRQELLEVLEEWILLGIAKHDTLPVVDGRAVVVPEVGA